MVTSKIQELVTRWRAANKQRAELEAMAAKIKNEIEAPLEQEILIYAQTEGLTSIPLSMGTVGISSRKLYTIADKDKFYEFQLRQLERCKQDNRSFVDGLFLQQRIHQGNLDEYIDNVLSTHPNATDEERQACLEAIGIVVASSTHLTFRNKK